MAFTCRKDGRRLAEVELRPYRPGEERRQALPKE